MILIPLRFGLFTSATCLGLGLYFLHEVFATSGKDLIEVVLAAPLFCSVGLVLFWTTLAHHRIIRRWEHYRRGQDNESTLQN